MAKKPRASKPQGPPSGKLPLTPAPAGLLGELRPCEGEGLIEAAVWYEAEQVGDGLAFELPTGALAGAQCLWADMLLDGDRLAVFQLALREGPDGPRFVLTFALLNQCSARMRMPLAATDQNRWRLPRQAAWLKPMCGGDRVDPAKVDRMTLTVLRKSDGPVRWCMTPITAAAEPPPRLAEPVLPRGKLLDELGQSALHDWPGKSRSADEVADRLAEQLAAAGSHAWPEGFSRWGGWSDAQFEATGFFRTHKDADRWWLVDPDGHAFWSAGLDCVRSSIESACDGLGPALAWLPEDDEPFAQVLIEGGDGGRCVNYLAANFIRTFGPVEWYDAWSRISLGQLRRFGFNTVANWSEWQIASAAGFPYVRPLSLRLDKTPMVYRDFPDVFAASFAEDAAAFADPLHETRDDPALIGYFLMNEPNWGFSTETPAAGMLFATPQCASREALGGWLTERYGSDEALAKAWGLPVTLAAVAAGPWQTPLTDPARADLAEFSTQMVERLFTGLSEACRSVDPHHLNLGARYYTVPPAWALAGMHCFDVFSINCYRERVGEDAAGLAEAVDRPVMVGEWHFGALDAGLPASGIGHVRTQADRGRAFRVYTEDAAARPWCVGVHYFTMYDQSALGRFDGENYNIGFLDVCNRPYEPLAEAARQTHARLYRVALGEVEPFADAPEYLPKLFL